MRNTIMTNPYGMKCNQAKALMLAQRAIAIFVYDAVNLEGIAFTLPEIQTLLDGITVGGHKLSDQQIAINQGNAWRYLFTAVKNHNFSLSAEFACKLHNIAAKEDALEWGRFRTGQVMIAGTNYSPPEAHELDERFMQMIAYVEILDDIYDKAISTFMTMARSQFFYDVNKRMGRFMMNGILLSSGYPAINVPARRQLEFNQLMLSYYETAEKGPMNQFMRSCLEAKVIEIMSE